MASPESSTIRAQVLRWQRNVAAAEAAERRAVESRAVFVGAGLAGASLADGATRARDRLARLGVTREVLADVLRYVDGEFPLIANTIPGEKEKT